jgi:cytoskeletal protein RodZ
MTRTEVVASSRPRKAAAPLSRGASRSWRRLSVVPIALLLAALLVPATAIAAEATSGYSQTAPTPKTTPTTPTTGTTPTTSKTTPATKETSPSKESKETSPSSEEKSTKATSPTSSTSASKSKSSTLPFTGFDLRWSWGIGLLLIGAGFSLVLVERRHRRGTGR